MRILRLHIPGDISRLRVELKSGEKDVETLTQVQPARLIILSETNEISRMKYLEMDGSRNLSTNHKMNRARSAISSMDGLSN